MDNDDRLEIPDFLKRDAPEEISISADVVDHLPPKSMPAEITSNSETQDSQLEGADQTDLKPHPLADMFPMMKGEKFTALVTSIQKDGLEEPIVTYEGKVLDGRNRYAACTEAQIDPVFDEYKGDDPLGFVLRRNLHRRHLITSQRSIIAAKMANINQGERTDLEPSANLQKVSVTEAAEKFNVSPRSVETAKSVLTKGDEELIAAVESGEMSVSAAAKQVKQALTHAVIPPEGERQSEKLLKLWVKSGDEGRALFLEAIGATI